MDKVINFPARAQALELPLLPATDPLPAGTTPEQVSALLGEIDAAFNQVERHLDTLRSAALRAAGQQASDAGVAADLWHSEHVQPLQDRGWDGAWTHAFYGLSDCVLALAAHLQEWGPAAAQVARLDERHQALGAALETVANIIEESAAAGG